jgi:NRPS condensation-like uncharacterized protein
MDNLRNYRVESFDLWHYLGRHRDFSIRFRVDFEGQLDEAALREALELSCVTLPLIACSFDTSSKRKPRWVERAEARREILRVVEVDEGNRETEALQAFTESPNIEQGPQLSVVLIRAGKRDTLHFRMNHMVCDGAGVKEYLSELARLYSQIIEGLKPTPTPFCPERSLQPIFRGLTLAERLRATFASYRENTVAGMAAYKDTGLPFGNGPIHTMRTSLPAERFRGIRDAAKALGFTVNDVLAAAIARTWYRMVGMEKLKLVCTMDFRGFALPRATMGIANLSGNCPCLIQFSPDETMESTLAQFAEQMRDYKQGIRGINQLIRWDLIANFSSYQRLDKTFDDWFVSYPVLLSNLGVTREECVQFGDIPVSDAFFGLPASRLAASVIAFSTFRDVPTIAFNVKGDEAAMACARETLETLLDELLAFEGRHMPSAGQAAFDYRKNDVIVA